MARSIRQLRGDNGRLRRQMRDANDEKRRSAFEPVYVDFGNSPTFGTDNGQTTKPKSTDTDDDFDIFPFSIFGGLA
jgi:hypothetical protein